MSRIVSLIPSGTEIVHAIGLGDHVVGRSHECDFPASVRSLPVCSEPRIDVNASSHEIDRQVKASLSEALSIYRVSGETLNHLQPTHIITQSQCEVCAVSLQDVETAVCAIIGSKPTILSLQPMQMSDLWNDIVHVAGALGVEERGADLVERLQQRLKRVQEKATVSHPPLQVVCLEWLEPLMSAGNWVPELVEIAGGKAMLCKSGEHSPYFEWETLQRADPEVIVLMPCGFDIPRTLSEIDVLTSRPEWKSLAAVRSGRIFVVDGNQYFNRPGPRLVESAEILSEIFEAATGADGEFPHQGTGWIKLMHCD
ncbi:cobalamin-binding protein [Planctomicrobium sp. SH668]|uniref:cobalamin-binding protein n=1 Tax=Planctomicrobium sp. SH668 TaxID=3448126 RepID=UPI003F5B74E7